MESRLTKKGKMLLRSKNINPDKCFFNGDSCLVSYETSLKNSDAKEFVLKNDYDDLKSKYDSLLRHLEYRIKRQITIGGLNARDRD